jgi:competence protein ComEA
MPAGDDNYHKAPILQLLLDYRWPLIVAVLSIVCLGGAVFTLVSPGTVPEPIEFTQAGESGIVADSLIQVDIEGAVARPGVYSLPLDARIDDAIATAGGLTDSADTSYIAKRLNRAARLVDGGKLFIPQTEPETSFDPNRDSSPVFGAADSESEAPENLLISINDGTVDELESLPGVGPVTAQKIIDNRPYQTLEELMVRKAVGKSVWQKIQSLISL